ncbi:MAG: phospholipase D family protein [Methylococcales bacterium]|nr:phospholipase D family protein [Methylococcales bacterium]
MKIEFLNAKQVGEKLNELIISTNEFYCAVAWATDIQFANSLLENKDKIGRFIVGIDFARTSDEFLETLQPVENVRYMPNNGERTFHPKIYYFESGDNAFAIVGSSNCTGGGLSNNEEASLFIQGAKNHLTFKEIRKKIENWFADGLKITDDFLKKYKKIKVDLKKQDKSHELRAKLETLSNPPTIDNFDIENSPRIHIAWYRGKVQEDECAEEILNNMVDCNTFLEDDEIDAGDIVLNWKCTKNGLPHGNAALSFFRIDEIVKQGYDDKSNYTKLAYQKEGLSKLVEPFQLDKKTQKCIKDVLASDLFKDIFYKYEDWKSPKQEDVKKFLRHVQSEYKKTSK